MKEASSISKCEELILFPAVENTPLRRKEIHTYQGLHCVWYHIMCVYNFIRFHNNPNWVVVLFSLTQNKSEVKRKSQCFRWWSQNAHSVLSDIKAQPRNFLFRAKLLTSTSNAMPFLNAEHQVKIDQKICFYFLFSKLDITQLHSGWHFNSLRHLYKLFLLSPFLSWGFLVHLDWTWVAPNL